MWIPVCVAQVTGYVARQSYNAGDQPIILLVFILRCLYIVARELDFEPGSPGGKLEAICAESRTAFLKLKDYRAARGGILLPDSWTSTGY
jgi:hypothetical protein